MIQTVTNHIYTGYPTWQAKTAFAMCAIPAAEMAIRLLGNCLALSSVKLKKNDQELLVKNVSKNLAGALFYGICATNAVPYSSYGGAVIFSLYAASKHTKKDSYSTARLIGTPISYIGTEILFPFLEAIKNIASAIPTPFLNLAGRLFNAISLPKNPAWYGVLALVAAIIVIRFNPQLVGRT